MPRAYSHAPQLKATAPLTPMLPHPVHHYVHHPSFLKHNRKRQDTEMSAPSMKERKACWDARDYYWKCLDENLEDAVKCKTFKGAFENTCPQQWVKYFNKRREYLKFKAQLEAGALDEPLEREKL